MKNKVMIFVLCFPVVLESYNIAYDGDDAEFSYETHGVKEQFIKDEYIKYFPYYKKWKEDYSHVDIKKISLKRLPFPYSLLQKIRPFDYGGFYYNGEYIKKMFALNNFSSALEIGSFLGVSTRHIASLLSQGSKVWAVDSWALWPDQYERFLSNIVISGLTHKIIPVRLKSDDAVEIFRKRNEKIDFIFVDGDHDTDPVLSDLENYFPLLSSTGVICGDDWLVKTVRIAVLQFAEKYNLTVYGDCNFWFLKKEDCGYCYKSFLTVEDSAWKFGSK